MSAEATNYLFDKITMPTVVDGDISTSWSSPEGAKVLTIHTPAMTSNATVKIQVLDPRDGNYGAETWRDLQVVVINTTIAFMTFSGITQSSAITIPVAALGAGIFRFVSSAVQTGAIGNKTILLSWGKDA